MQVYQEGGGLANIYVGKGQLCMNSTKKIKKDLICIYLNATQFFCLRVAVSI